MKMLSIITPNLNNGEYLEENIQSIQKLSIPFEHIIVDGGSTDNSLEIISKYPHIKLIHQTDRLGMYAAIDQGIKLAQGDIVCWVNSDDRIIKEGYEKMYSTINSKNADLVYSDGEFNFIHENKRQQIKGSIFGKFFLQNGLIPTLQPSIIFTKDIYLQVGGFDYGNFKICGDLDLFMKIANTKESKISYTPTTSSIFIKRGDSLGDLNTERYLQELRQNKIKTPSFLVKVLFFISKKI